MKEKNLLEFVRTVINELPNDWLTLTTHRLDIYNEKKAKTEFVESLDGLYKTARFTSEQLLELPTAYDYIRLGHPLSTVLEWAIAKDNDLPSEHVISFSSKTTPILAILRKNLITKRNTRIAYNKTLPSCFDAETILKVYGYRFEVVEISDSHELPSFDGTTVFVSSPPEMGAIDRAPEVDFHVALYESLGSILTVNKTNYASYISEIQHVRRRETIAMTPANCLKALEQLVNNTSLPEFKETTSIHKETVLGLIHEITGAHTKAVIGSSGLSIQYAIMMGLIDEAMQHRPGKPIKIIVPPNCYGGTNDQARRVAECVANVEILDLPVDGQHNMVQSIDLVLDRVALEDGIPYIIAEIPTNPRVEVPNLNDLHSVLARKRYTSTGKQAIDPVFILDQTFCPNVQFLPPTSPLSGIQIISYVSGSKFPSGGKCTAGYCSANAEAEHLMNNIEKHLFLCDNEATDLQLEFLTRQMPSMNARIQKAYINTRSFVHYIMETLPNAKINFVSDELAQQGFTPSVFSLDLPTKGDNPEDLEAYKRQLNQRLIDLMITRIPNESKYCVSYGQLKGCYWTIPATSTQGTTKEGDKDYIVRVALSHDMDLQKHKEVFAEFVATL